MRPRTRPRTSSPRRGRRHAVKAGACPQGDARRVGPCDARQRPPIAVGSEEPEHGPVRAGAHPLARAGSAAHTAVSADHS
jgi:hypothetical protein